MCDDDDQPSGEEGAVGATLHADDVIIYDTGAADSISTNESRFISGSIDRSDEAKRGGNMNGIGGGVGVCGGTGVAFAPVKVVGNDEMHVLFDPKGKLIEKQTEDEPDITVWGERKMKRKFGVY